MLILRGRQADPTEPTDDRRAQQPAHLKHRLGELEKRSDQLASQAEHPGAKAKRERQTEERQQYRESDHVDDYPGQQRGQVQRQHSEDDSDRSRAIVGLPLSHARRLGRYGFRIRREAGSRVGGCSAEHRTGGMRVACIPQCTA